MLPLQMEGSECRQARQGQRWWGQHMELKHVLAHPIFSTGFKMKTGGRTHILPGPAPSARAGALTSSFPSKFTLQLFL